ncbi:MAG: ATP-binding cassette domain-containing protein [Chloroflexi bacterium]|nr:ATP-binding cassette domain-containing protein [Chloroflexota bacterium]
MSLPAAITMIGVDKKFGQKFGLKNVSLEVREGEIYCLLGPSGSGKTTAIRVMCGYYLPDGGKVKVLGYSPAEFGRQLVEHIGYMPQLFVLYHNLTVLENLQFMASVYGLGSKYRRQRIDQMLEMVQLADARNKLASQISGGMQRRLSLACALLHEPRLLFIDEPTAGIDPILRERFWEEFRALRAKGCTLVITTQYVGEAIYCDTVGIMRSGQLIAQGTPEGLRQQALGGDVIDVVVGRIEPGTVQALLDLEMVHRVDIEGRFHMVVIVTEARRAIPAIMQTLQDRGMKVLSIDDRELTFDEVFVRLVRDTPEGQGQDMDRHSPDSTTSQSVPTTAPATDQSTLTETITAQATPPETTSAAGETTDAITGDPTATDATSGAANIASEEPQT